MYAEAYLPRSMQLYLSFGIFRTIYGLHFV
jgi:hypothetical protein